jgi:hypothetical protein
LRVHKLELQYGPDYTPDEQANIDRDNKAMGIFESIHQSSINTVHWIFAVNYWALACKLELLKEKKVPTQNDTRNKVIAVIGLLFNILAGALWGKGPKNKHFLLVLTQLV